MLKEEQIPGEVYHEGDKIKVYVIEYAEKHAVRWLPFQELIPGLSNAFLCN